MGISRRSFVAALIGGTAFSRRLPELTTPSPVAIPVPAPITVAEQFIPMLGDKFQITLGELLSGSTWVSSIEAHCDPIEVTSLPWGPVHEDKCNITQFRAAWREEMRLAGRVMQVPYDEDFPEDCYDEYPEPSAEAAGAVTCNCNPRSSAGYKEYVPGPQYSTLKGRIGFYSIVAMNTGLPKHAPDFRDTKHTFVVTAVCASISPGDYINMSAKGYDRVG